MNEKQKAPDTLKLICKKCQQDMVLGKVTVTYLGATFPIELLRCPSCGLVYVPESLATGKMEQVEQSLEDK
jgi:uncharacterized Zn finger protein